MFTRLKIMLVISFICICVHKETFSQANNGQPSITRTLSNRKDCATYTISAFHSFDCKFANGTVCDSHCRCTHGAKWGQCIERPPGGPVASIGSINNLMCACYYDSSPPANSANQLDPLVCAAWMVANKENYLCNVHATTDTDFCSADCICAHGFQGGSCDPAETNFCLCHNNPPSTL